MNCNECDVGAIQRLIACDDCSNGMNFNKIFKLITFQRRNKMKCEECGGGVK